MSTVIEKDMVLEGPLWPEPVRVLRVDHFGTMLQVDAVGTRSRQFYPGIIVTAAQVETLKVVSSAKGMDFSGDPDAFHLANVTRICPFADRTKCVIRCQLRRNSM